MELEAKIRLLEKQKAQLERKNDITNEKAIIFDMMIDIAEREFKIDIRKMPRPGNSSVHKPKGRKYKLCL